MSDHDIQVLTVLGLLFAVIAAEVLLGLYILLRSRRAPAAVLMGLYLILHAFAIVLMGSMGVIEALGTDLELGSRGAWFNGIQALMAVLPGLLLAFALTYPNRFPPARRSRSWFLLPILPTLAVVALNGLEAAGLIGWHPERCEATSTWSGCFGVEWPGFAGLVAAASWFVVGTGVACLLFWNRQRHATTRLEQRRLRFMTGALGIPMAVSGFGVLVGVVAEVYKALYSASDFVLVVAALLGSLGILVFLLVPAFTMAYGVLIYRILDLDRRLRLALRGVGFGALFILVFFALSEGAESYLALRTNSRWVGLGGALVLAVAFRPIDRLLDRVTRRMMPTGTREAAQAKPHRLELYRASFEDLSGDGELNRWDRMALESLAFRLRLTHEDVRALEADVERERSRRLPAPVSAEEGVLERRVPTRPRAQARRPPLRRRPQKD